MASENENSNTKSSSLPKLLVPVLAIGGLGVMAVMGLVAAFVITGWLGQPVPVLGFEQTFDQPIDFPHTIHASTKQLDYVPADKLGTMVGLGLDCTFCHRTVTTQANAGIPPVAFCVTCHQVIGAADNTQLTILRDAADIIGDDGPEPINWRRVHRLPDHVRFVHEPHIRYLTQNPDAFVINTDGVKEGPSGVCSTCHGNVAAMKQVEQVEPLKMGQCVDCHRDNGAPTDCVACHY
ncbi:MAG: cytochrome c3 family protein [Chloroflexi bacterium]|nr:cytochrome c3 family protein [Chloroflexota bacterium]